MARRYNMTATDTRAIVNTAARLGIRPDVLASVIAYETMGTMNPTIKGGKGGNYQGLIQFGPPERKRYGYSADASFAEQVEGPVYRYLKDRGVKPGHGVAEVYSIINAGSLKNGKPRWNASDGNGTVRSHVQNIISRIMPRMASMLEGAAPSHPNMDAIADVANYSQVDGGSIRQPETAVASSPQTAAAAIADLIDAPAGPPVDALAYNMARAAPVAGQAQAETMVGGMSPPNPRLRPDRLAPPGESMVRPNDYIAGLLSGASPDAMNAGNYASRPLYQGDQITSAGDIPAPSIRPRTQQPGFPGSLDYITSGNVPNPNLNPQGQGGVPTVDIPSPRLRPVETQTSPSLVVGPPPRPIGALPAATPERMSDAEYQAMRDEVMALPNGTPRRPVYPSTGMEGSPEANPGSVPETPEQAYQRLLAEDRMSRQKGELVNLLPSPDTGPFASGPYPGPYRGPQYAPDFTAAAPGKPIEQMAAENDYRELADDFSSLGEWWNAGGVTPAAADPLASRSYTEMAFPPATKQDYSRVPEATWFATQPYPVRPPSIESVVDTVSPISYKYDTLQDSAGAGTIKGGTGRPVAPPSRLMPGLPDSPEQGWGINGDPYWGDTGYYNTAPQIIGQPDNINQGSEVGDRSMSQGGLSKPLEITIPVSAPQAPSLPSVPGRVISPTGWQEVRPTDATPSTFVPGQPIDIRPPAAGGPVVAPPSVVPQKPAPPQITSAPTQKQTAALGVLSTILGGPGRLFGGGGGGLFGGGSPFAQSSANAFQATGGGQHPSGQTYKTGTIGSTNWNAGQYDNSRGQTVTYATDPWQGGYMVSIG